MPPRPSFRVALLLPALALAGCGVADYERKMQEAEARVQRFDEENKLLGDPLLLPPRADKVAPAVDVFLRPPKGVAAKPDPPQGDLPYHYPATGLCTDLYLMVRNPGDGPDNLEKQVESWFGMPAQNWRAVEVRPPSRPPIGFEAVEFFDPRAPTNAPALTIAYVHRPTTAVAFRIPQANRAAAGDVVKMSLETYAEAGDAQKARADYDKRPH